MERKGYDPEFLGNSIKVPHPEITPRIEGTVFKSSELRKDKFFDYVHYTIVMNKKTRQLMYSASNIDQNLLREHTRTTDKWHLDSRMPDELQLDNDYYKGTENPYDRGHMVRRANNCWAESEDDVKAANDDTFYYTNSSLQHEYYNQDEWVGLEDMFLDWKLDADGKLCIFTGPVHRPFDRCFHRTFDDAARIPSAFFKIICYRGKESQELETRAFLLYQDEEFTNNKRSGGTDLRAQKYAKYQVSIADIENLTGLEFDNALPSSNPIYFNTPDDAEAVKRVYRYPERVPIIVKEDLVNNIIDNRETQEARDEDKVLRIAAAMVNPEGRDSKSKEWVSIMNVSAKRVNLEGWVLWNSKGKTAQLKGAINAGSSKVISMKDYDFSLVNEDVHLVLRNPDKDTVDIAGYTKQQAKNSEGMAIAF